MSRSAPQSVEAAIERHFTDPARTTRLEAGQTLLRQGEPNTRLYRVRHGLVAGSIEEDDGTTTPVMRAGPGDLVGVQSFFGVSNRSTQNIVALEDTELGYLDRDTPIPPGEPSLERLLMPLVLNELLRRQKASLELAERERQTRERLDQLERVSALGQLAAAVAHELNNALTVLVRGTSWIARVVQQRVDHNEKVLHRAFDVGLVRGRGASAAEARQRVRQIEKQFGVSFTEARKLAATGLSDEQLKSFNLRKEGVDRVFQLWELGATIHDMRLASDQAEHVVTSMRDLGANRALEHEPTDVNDTIRTALKILRGQLESIEVTADLGELPMIRGSRGKLVQVWTNIIKNALEAMTAGGTPRRRPAIHVRSSVTAEEVVVTIDDTGPGIPPDVLPRIFEPSFTTKKQGLSFGLGLGLSIVQRLVSEHGGDVEAVNHAAGARFIIRLPREVLDE
ncbi:MAG: cyclic nucleotide-binding domain-containing protein [Planctomycetes bacterium]|nr:cyclic nucleotide-binding domain-containing protein [Planctomycetota bacterium]